MDNNSLDYKEILCLANTNSEYWKILKHARMVTKDNRNGEIVQINESDKGDIIIEVLFENENVEKKYTSTSFEIGYITKVYDLKIDTVEMNKIKEEIEKAIAKAELQNKITQKFKELKKKYYIEKYNEKSPDSLLYKIIDKLEAEEDLDSDELNWLDTNHLYQVIAKGYWIKALKGDITSEQNIWYIVCACSNYRRAKVLKEAIELADLLTESMAKWDYSDKLISAIYNTAGGAYADIGDTKKLHLFRKEAERIYPGNEFTYNLKMREFSYDSLKKTDKSGIYE